MKHLFLLFAATLLASGAGYGQTTPNTQPAALYENYGVIDDTSHPSPQIDALAFANYGTFTVTTSPFLTDFPYTQFGYLLQPSSTVVPYDFQNTINFTNSGSMTSFTGFRFDTAFGGQPRRSAANFVNKVGGTITGSPYLLVTASNLVNRGVFSASADGLIQLKGQHIDLSRSGLQIQRLGLDFGGCIPENSFPITTTNFLPDVGIVDLLARLNTNGLPVTTLLSTNADQTVSVSAPLPVGNLTKAKPFVRYSQLSPTNWFYQAVFVQTRDSNITSTVKFATFPPPPQGNNRPFLSPVVKMTATESNIVTGALDSKSIYLWDTLASEKVIGAETNLVYLTNVVAGTIMPSPYYVSRTAPCEYFLALGPNYTITNNFFYNSTYSNNIVTNVNAAYVAGVSPTSGQLPALSSATITNITSRIEIEADTLDLTAARFASSGLISVKAKNLISSANASVQVANLNFDLGSRDSSLLIKDLAFSQVPTFEGNIRVWSGYWTNQTGITVTNIAPDPANPMGSVTNVDTNVVDIVFHAMFVNNQLFTSNSVVVNDLTMRGSNVVYSEDLTVSHTLLIDSERFALTKEGKLTLLGGTGLDSLTAPNAPTLRYLTNAGTLTIPNHADFGLASKPLSTFVNSGSLSAFTEAIHADQFENSGTISATGPLRIGASAAKLDGGRLAAGVDIWLTGGDFKLRNHSQASAGLLIAVTNSLNDSGVEARNTLATTAGFQLPYKPLLGDLFGTTLRTTAPRLADVRHAWAAEDRGATVAGFSNNVAIGVLEIEAAEFADVTFGGTGTKNGLYVDFLRIGPSLTNDFENRIHIEPNLVIYFADANLPVEDLDGKFAGHLRWVKDFAGPNSSIDAIVCASGVGSTVKMNRALRYSTTIDSDDDGTANAFDSFPLNADALCETAANVPANSPITSYKVISRSPLNALVSFSVTPKQIYQIEYTSDLNAPVWKIYSRVTNNATTGAFKFELQNALPAGEAQRFYRVRTNP